MPLPIIEESAPSPLRIKPSVIMDQPLRDLIKRFHEVCEGDENKRRRSMMCSVDRLETTERIPVYFSVPFDWSFIRINLWKELLHTDLDISRVVRATGEYPADLARAAIAFQLRQRIFYIEKMPGDFPISPSITTNFNLLWLNNEPNINPLWTRERIQYDMASGDFHLIPFIKTREDFKNLTVHPYHVDFDAHRQRVALFQELTGGSIEIKDDLLGYGMLNSFRSPFQELSHLREFMELLMDLRENPGFIHEMMSFLTDASIARAQEMNRVNGKAIFQPCIGGDEVNCQIISPADYDEYILPYERKIAAEGKNYYYHSCGNLTPIFDRIVNLPNIQKIHVSPWSDLRTAVSAIGRRAVIQKIVGTQQDIMQNTDAGMVSLLTKIREVVGDTVMEVACHCETYNDFERSKRFVELGKTLMTRR